MLKRMIVLVSVLLLATGLQAEDRTNDLDRLFEVAKVEPIFRAYEGLLIDGFLGDEEFMGDLRPGDLNAIEAQHLAASVLADDLRNQMAGKLTTSQIDANIAFYDSDLGRRVTSAEASSALFDIDVAETQGSEILVELQDRNPKRVALIDDIMHTFREVAAAQRGVMNIVYAITALANHHPSNPAPLSDDQITEVVNEMTQSIVHETEYLVRVSHAFTYRELSDAELAAYVRFLKTPEGAAFYLAWQDGEIDVVSRRLPMLVSDVLDLMQQKRS